MSMRDIRSLQLFRELAQKARADYRARRISKREMLDAEVWYRDLRFVLAMS